MQFIVLCVVSLLCSLHDFQLSLVRHHLLQPFRRGGTGLRGFSFSDPNSFFLLSKVSCMQTHYDKRDRIGVVAHIRARQNVMQSINRPRTIFC